MSMYAGSGCGSSTSGMPDLRQRAEMAETLIRRLNAEIFSDDKGLSWPKEISPFTVHLVCLGNDEKVKKFTDDLYDEMRKKDIEVLYDDRDLRAGEKFADSDLIGIPLRLVVSEKTVGEGKVEVKYRTLKNLILK